jgi:hypothetical protein
MTGHRPFRELTKGFSPEREARVAGKAAALERQAACTVAIRDGEPKRASFEQDDVHDED